MRLAEKIQRRRKRQKTESPCQTPVPTPAAGYVVYAENQRCLEAHPFVPPVRRELVEARALQPTPTDVCYANCASIMSVPFYFAVSQGTCYW